MSPKKILLIIGLILSLSVAGYATWFFYFNEETPANNNTNITNINQPVVLVPPNTTFKLQADSIDSLGVDGQSTFTLTSTKPVEKKVITTSLVISPQIGYKLESSDNNTFKIIPKEKLAANTIYTFKIATASAEAEKPQEYSWAYQIKDTFKITGTLPRDKATGVPIDSGIEVTFSHENFENYQDYFTLSPATEGRFEVYRKTLVFVPKELVEATVYTVTVKKGLPLKGTDKKLSEDTIFRFETKPAKGDSTYSYFSLGNNFIEYPVNEAPVLGLQEYGTGLSQVEIKVYKFSSFEDFVKAAKAQYQDIPWWAGFARKKKLYPTEGLNEVTSFTTEIKTGDMYNFQKYLAFPTGFEKGDYLVHLQGGDYKEECFLQVTPLAATFQASPTQSFFWVNNVETKKPVAEAQISFSEQENFSAKTNGEGLATFDTPDLLKQKSDLYENKRDKLYYFILTSGAEKLFIPSQNSSFYWYYGWGSGQADYWSYLYPNRTLYQPTDKILFWGLAKKRDGSSLNKLIVKLLKSEWSDAGTKETLVTSQEVKVGSLGTYQGELNFKNINPGYGYHVAAYDGENKVADESVSIQTYTKPPYQLEITTPKKAIFEGEKAVFKLATSFFDGTPVPNIELNISGFKTEKITTDQNGQATLTYNTSYTNSDYSSQSHYFSAYPVNSEIADVSADAYLIAFGPHYGLNVAATQAGKISGSVYNINLDKINADPKEYVWDYEGEPVANAKVKIKIYHQWYEKIETGSVYDFINKKNIKSYRYDAKENLVGEKEAVTDSEGKYSYDFAPEKKNYKIIASTTDKENRTAKQTTWLYQGGEYFGYYQSGAPGENYYLTSPKDQDWQTSYYTVGEKVSLTINKNEAPLTPSADDAFLYFKDHNGLFDVQVSKESQLKFDFQASYAPNIYVKALYFNGRTYRETNLNSLVFDKNQKALKIKITPEKNEYKPGENASLEVTITNQEDKAVADAEVNVSLIDAALASIQWERWGNILDKVYATISSSLTDSYASHEQKAAMAAAERGGCFTGETKILMADRSQKTLEKVRVGDYILTRKTPQSSELVQDRVVRKTEHVVNEYLTINGFLNVTPIHVVWLNDAWQPIGRAKVGDYLKLSNGAKLIINSIVPHKQAVKVYNLYTENYHTFIADNVYVHNEKAGRENFQDVAYFGRGTTDAAGQTKVTFKLPDNITSWQVTAQAVTADLQVGGGQSAVIVSQPFFVDVAMVEKYLAADKPKIKLRSYGKGLTAGAEIKYEISYPEQNIETKKITGQAFESAWVDLPSLGVGNHKIRIKAKAGNLEDIITKSFSVIESNLLKNTQNFYTLSEETKVTGAADRPTELTFSHKERGYYYNQLKWRLWTYGDRFDQKIARFQAQSLLNTYFKEEISPADFSFTLFQPEDGGVAILPYSSSDLLFSAKAAEVAADRLDKLALKSFFQKVLANQKSNIDEVVYAIYGLANLGEPILTDLNIFLSNHQDLSPQLKLYLIRGLANLGAKEYAESLLTEILTKYGEEMTPYIRLKLGEEEDDYTENTFQAAVIAAKVSLPQAFALFDYAVSHPAKLQLNTLDELSYLTAALPNIPNETVSFSYQLDGEKKSVTLKNNELYSLALNADQLAKIKFSSLSGQVGLVATFKEPLDPAKEKTDSNVSLNRSYSTLNRSTTAFKDGEVVKITLSPTKKKGAMDTAYQITDYLPAGLQLLTNLYRRGYNYGQNVGYPFEVDGQAVKFGSYYTSSFYYYALVVGKGEFVAEEPVIEGFKVKASQNFGPSATVKIE